MDSLINC